jgi:hypothetical protein
MNQKIKHRRKPATPDAGDRQWQQHWSKAGLPGYELPIGGPGGDERDFLSIARTPAKEKARLKRISREFERAFKIFYDVGPAVTVFGSARFREDHCVRSLPAPVIKRLNPLK